MTTQAGPLPEGEVVAGKYRLGPVLGEGGMGVVVAATHVQLEQRVALKFLRVEALGNPEIVARFTREAQAAARIQGVHVARVLDVGELPSGAPFMVMEYLEGEDLDRVLRRRGPLPIAEAVDLLLQACEAVAEAHALGIVHRDLKPANLFLARYPGGRQIVKVLDFGISKLQGPTGSPGLTQAASMFGSPPYMAPEQVRSARAADARSDVWSLGAVLYELLTGVTPFPAESVQALFAAILFEDPKPACGLRAEIPPPLEALVTRCLEKDPTRRFQDIAALAAALGPFAPASSADVPARIARIVSTGATAVLPSVTAMAEGAAPSLATVPDRSLGGVGTVASAETAAAPVPAVTPVTAPAVAPPPPVAAPAPVPAISPASRPPRRSIPTAVLALAGVAIGGAAVAIWIGTGTPRVSSDARQVAAPPPPVAPQPAPAAAPPPAASPPAAVAPPEPRHHTGSAARPHEQHAGAATPPAAAPAFCADLLARQSLGETLTPDEASAYARSCRK
ncbi:MAG TPA: serine/threonine-protein kinase [Polyangia bacterium]|nr:serine/threonine-protein kinase [Polyangia bacterium]